MRPGRASSESTGVRHTRSVLCSLFSSTRPVPSSSESESERGRERGRGALSDKVVCGMRYAVCMSHSRPQPSAVSRRPSMMLVSAVQACTYSTYKHAWTLLHDRPTRCDGRLMARDTRVHTYVPVPVPVCTSPKTRGDSRKLRGAGCGLR